MLSYEHWNDYSCSKATGHLLCGDVVGAAKEGAIAVNSAVGGNAVKEVLGDTDWAEIADTCQF